MADQVKEMPVGDMTMPGEEMDMSGAEEMNVMPGEEMDMLEAMEMNAMPGEEMNTSRAEGMNAMPMDISGEIKAIELPGTWKIILSQTSFKGSGCS